MNNQAGRRILSTLLAAALGVSAMLMGTPVTPQLQAGAAAADLGPITHYNGIMFSSIIAHQADVEGAIAVGGNSTFGSTGHSYGMGAAVPYHSTVHIGKYTNTKGYPTLLLNGSPQFKTSGNVAVKGGPAVLNSSSRGSYLGATNTFEGTVKYEQDDLVAEFFQETYVKTLQTSKAFPGANSAPSITLSSFLSGGYGSNMGQYLNQNLQFEQNPGRVLSINVEGSDTQNLYIGEVRLAAGIKDYDVVVFNFPQATNVYFQEAGIIADGKLINTSAPPGVSSPWIDYAAENAKLANYAQRVIWNFPEAESIEIKGKGIVGSVIAPEADVVATGGSINGMLICDVLEQKGGFELHAFTMKNVFADFAPEDLTGSIRIVKIDESQPSIHLLGAEFDLRQDSPTGTIVEHIVIDAANPQPEIHDLPLGTYYLVETKAPPGYEIAAPKQIVLDEDHYFDTYEIAVENRLKEADVSLLKTDGSSPLPDAFFALFWKDADGKYHYINNVESDASGTILIPGLTIGTYYLVEIDPPDGHIISPDYEWVKIEVEDTGGPTLKTTVTNTQGTEIDEIPNDTIPPGTLNLQVLKVDWDDHNNGDRETTIPGAEFELEKDDGLGTWSPFGQGTYTTDEFGMISVGNLTVGDYRFKESLIPDGYSLVDEDGNPMDTTSNGGWIYFNVFDKGNNYLAIGYSGQKPGTRTDNTIYLYNRGSASIEVTKVDANDSSVRLEGAEFVLYRKVPSGNEMVREDLVTGKDGRLKIEDLRPGTYFLEETKAPSGYQRPVLDRDNPGVNPIEITLGYSESMNRTYTFENTPIDIQLEIVKVDGVTETPLSGAEFDLYYFDRVNRDWGSPIHHFTTGGDGRIRIEELDTNQLTGGTYKFVETKVPDGYSGALDYDGGEYVFNVNYDATNPVLKLGRHLVTNLRESSLGSVEVVKVDGRTHQGLAGAVFRLSRRLPGESGYTEYRTGLTSGADGKLVIPNLQPADYALLETQAPEGYQQKTEAIHFTLETDSGGLVIPLDPITVANYEGDGGGEESSGGSGGGSGSGGGGSSGGSSQQDRDRARVSEESSRDPGSTLNPNPLPSAGANNPSTGLSGLAIPPAVAWITLAASGGALWRKRRRRK